MKPVPQHRCIPGTGLWVSQPLYHFLLENMEILSHLILPDLWLSHLDSKGPKMEAPRRCQGLGKTLLLLAAPCQVGLIWVWVYFRNRGERKTAWGVGGVLRQGGVVRDDREKRCRQTLSLGEKETGCGILPPPG